MARYQGSSTARGYGSKHQALRRRLLAAWRPGQPCARCGMPIWHLRQLDPRTGKTVSAVDLGHRDGKHGYAGLEHRSCNRRDGQAKTTAINRARGALTPPQLAAIRWKQWQKAATPAQARSW